jgi:hypothetical protein
MQYIKITMLGIGVIIVIYFALAGILIGCTVKYFCKSTTVITPEEAMILKNVYYLPMILGEKSSGVMKFYEWQTRLIIK